MSGWILALNGIADAWAAGILRASWQGGLALGGVWLICRAFPRVSPDAQCWLWRLATLKLLIALFWVTPADVPLLPPAPQGRVQAEIAVAPLSPQSGMAPAPPS